MNTNSFRQLFIDNFIIERSINISKSLHSPESKGPVLTGDKNFQQTGVQTRNAPQWNSQKKAWEWFYWAYYDSSTDARKDHYAISKDGINWDKPDLGLYEFNGAKNMPYDLPGGPTIKGRYMYHILRDEIGRDSSKRYKGFFGSRDRKIGFSPDGLKWEFPDIPMIPSYDESHLTYDEQSEQFIASVKLHTEWGRSVYLSTSKDFMEWSDPKLIFHADEIDNENRIKRIQFAVDHPEYLAPPVIEDRGYTAQVYQMAIMPYQGIYIGFPLIFNPAGPSSNNYTGLNQTELTVSRDLYNWERVADRELFLGIEKWDSKNFGYHQILPTSRPIVKDDGEIWFYYNAFRHRGLPKLFSQSFQKFIETNQTSAICLATLRPDGFVSLDAKNQGVVITKPIKINRNASIHINVDSTNGYLAAEVLDPVSMEPLPGYTFENCEKISEDSTDKKINWKTNDKINNDIVRLKFILEKSSLYSFWSK
ncbi:MAG: hypothetical protein ACJ0A9_00505 [Dehalococcoidia bacterium]